MPNRQEGRTIPLKIPQLGEVIPSWTVDDVFTGEIHKLPRCRRLLSSNTQETLAWCQCLRIDNV